MPAICIRSELEDRMNVTLILSRISLTMGKDTFDSLRGKRCNFRKGRWNMGVDAWFKVDVL